MGNVGEVEDMPSRAPKVKKAKSTSRMAPRAQGGTSRARSSHRGIHYDSGQGRNTVAALQGETAPEIAPEEDKEGAHEFIIMFG